MLKFRMLFSIHLVLFSIFWVSIPAAPSLLLPGHSILDKRADSDSNPLKPWIEGKRSEAKPKNFYYTPECGPDRRVWTAKSINRGNNGDVWSGYLYERDAETDKFVKIKEVAIKISNPVKRANPDHTVMVLKAADLQESMPPKNVVEIFGSFYYPVDDDQVAAVTVMEWIPGAYDLEHPHFADKKDKDTYYRPLLEDVEAIHDEGVAHLGLKPANLMMADLLTTGEINPHAQKVKITDFDRAVREDRSSDVVTNKGFTPPELHRERAPLTKPIDMWFLGILLPYFLGIYDAYSPEHINFWEAMRKDTLSREQSAEKMKQIGLKGMDDDLIKLLSKVLCKVEDRMEISDYIKAYDDWQQKKSN